MSSPWKVVAAPEPVNFAEIMSEELAKELQDRENEKFGRRLFQELSNTKEVDPGEASALPEEVLKALAEDPSVGDHCDSDAIIAQVLQAQFDQEHDDEVKKVEKHQSAKVKVSYKNFRIIPEELSWSEEEKGKEEESGEKDWDRFETVEKEYGSFPKCGYKQDEEGRTVTKHNARMAGIRNACRVMSFPPEFPTGDGAGFDMQLSNEVFNHLKSYSRKGKRNKMHDRKEEVATAEMGLDEPTRYILYKFVSNQVVERINGIISTGKEAVILHAEGDSSYEGDLTVPPECAIKIFKTTLNEFKQRDRYIKHDFRFRGFSKQNARTVIHQWAEKEMHNLLRMQRADIPCPDVVILKKHVLVMSFIGRDGRAAPKLKDAILSEAEWIVAYEEIVDVMKRLYTKAKLIHADLSEYNILWHEGKCWIIDVAQSVEPGHPSSLEFLMRDCGNICDFFDRRRVPGVATKEELFAAITDLDPSVHNAAMLERLHNKGVPEHVATNQGVYGEEDEAGASARWEHKSLPYPFDYAWEKSLEAKRQEAPLTKVDDEELTVQA